MKKYFYLISITLLLFSCDDGDIDVKTSEFSFDRNDLELCNTGSTVTNGDAVFFNINTETNETIAIALNRFYNDTIASVPVEENFEVTQNLVTYRKFESRVTDNYFCSGIPDTDLKITSQLNGDRGSVKITTKEIIDPNGDDDGDGLSNIDEGYDPNEIDFSKLLNTDGDKFPNFRDSDDDNDNIRTSAELVNDDTNTRVSRDSDNDGIPDHLDSDDDNDGVLTREEILETTENPLLATNEERIPLYLDPATSNARTPLALINNSFTSVFETNVVASNLGLVNGDIVIIRDNFPFGTFTRTNTNTNTVNFPEPTPEETPATTTTP